jgi:short-subunit dehydrogenase
MSEFTGRYGPWAIIAGASEGTGSAFARQVAAHGIHCILVARRPAPLAALAAEIRAAHSVECIAAAIDLANPDAAAQLVDAAGVREVGLFINNAGADPNSSRFLDRDVQVWNDLAARNVITTMRCCHHFGGAMKRRGRGGIVLIGSGACYGGASFMAVYSATKAFDLCFGEGLWAELRPHGVHVLNLILGRTDTPAFRTMLAQKRLPVPADLATPEAVAATGLTRLPDGPVHNFGLSDDVAGPMPNSANARRARILAIDAATKDVFGKD